MWASVMNSLVIVFYFNEEVRNSMTCKPERPVVSV